LAVDDQPVNIQAVYQIFSGDHQLFMATSGEQAMKLAAGEWSRAARSGTDLRLVLLDVDCFKRYNDLYGHLAGDACLRKVAECLRLPLKRLGDLVARYGGEEFVCLLPDTGLRGALELAQQLGAAVETLGSPHADSAAGPVVTVSLGVRCATHGAHGAADALVSAADAQLYRAKGGGPNRLCGGTLPVFADSTAAWTEV
jgi:diguanylate cyclase (GGDEF)-like protein